MRKPWLASTALVLVVVALGAAACGSSPKSATGTYTAKAAFCRADITIDKAGSNVNSETAFIGVIKANLKSVKDLATDAPPGTVGKEARNLSKSAQNVAATGNTGSLNNPALNADGAAVDTYCGVDGSGSPLPSYFAQGKGTAFCSVAGSINQGTNAATSSAQVLSFLAGHASLLSQYAADLSALPSPVKGDAQTLVTTAHTAISTNDANLLGTATVSSDSMNVQLYCGQNQ